MMMKAFNNNNFSHLIPPAFPVTSQQEFSKINKLLIISQDVNYNPILSKSQGKKLENNKKNGK